MGAGGLIQQASIAISGANDPSYYSKLPSHCKDKVEAITAKGAGACTEDDVATLLTIMLVAVHC